MAFAYDANGNRTNLTDTLGATTYVYDALNRLTSVTDGYGKTVSYAYDPIYRLLNEGISGDPTSVNNGTLTYSLDSVGNRQSLTSTLATIRWALRRGSRIRPVR